MTVNTERSNVKRWDFACDPDESSERSGGWTLAWRSVQPDPETQPRPGPLDGRQQLVDHARCLVGMHRCQGPTSLPAAPPSLPEASLLEEDGVASLLVAERVSLRQLSPGCWLLSSLRLPQPLASASRSQTDRQQPQDTQRTHPAAAAAAPDGLLHPPRHEV